MKDKVNNKNGSVLLVLIIVIAVITTLGSTSLNIAITHFQIKKSYSDYKDAFYMSESGLSCAYINAYELTCEAAAQSLSKADEYLSEYPDDEVGASNIFKNNYKSIITSMVNSKISSGLNPQIRILNNGTLNFANELLKIRVTSKYITESGIEKLTAADIIISVPDYIKTKSNITDFSSLIIQNNYDL